MVVESEVPGYVVDVTFLKIIFDAGMDIAGRIVAKCKHIAGRAWPRVELPRRGAGRAAAQMPETLEACCQKLIGYDGGGDDSGGDGSGGERRVGRWR